MERNPAADLTRMTEGMARGDEEPFREFYASYFLRLYRYLLVVARGEEELTRDCLQETMLRVVRNIRPFKDEAVFWGWLARVARTAFLDEMRRRKRRQFTAPEMDQWAFRLGAEERILRLLDEAVDDLDDQERSLIMGSYVDRQSHASLARERGITAKAVESQIARIRKKLRVRILERLNDAE